MHLCIGRQKEGKGVDKRWVGGGLAVYAVGADSKESNLNELFLCTEGSLTVLIVPVLACLFHCACA